MGTGVVAGMGLDVRGLEMHARIRNLDMGQCSQNILLGKSVAEVGGVADMCNRSFAVEGSHVADCRNKSCKVKLGIVDCSWCFSFLLEALLRGVACEVFHIFLENFRNSVLDYFRNFRCLWHAGFSKFVLG